MTQAASPVKLKMVLTSDDSQLFITVMNLAPDIIICRFIITATEIQCSTQVKTNRIDALLPLSLTNLLSISLDKTNSKVFIINIQWTVTPPIWSVMRS